VRPPGTCDAPYASAAGVADVTSSVPAALAQGEGGSLRALSISLQHPYSCWLTPGRVIGDQESPTCGVSGVVPGAWVRKTELAV